MAQTARVNVPQGGWFYSLRKPLGCAENKCAHPCRKSLLPMTPPRPLLAVFTALLLTSVSLWGAPSGGPYGPIQQDYALPTTSGTIYYVAPEADANAAGTRLDAPTSLESAIARVVTGDAIVLRGGEYRTGDLRLNQGITIQPYGSEQPVLKGTRVVGADQAVSQPNGLWRIKWETLFPLKPQPWWRRERNGATTPQWLFNNDMVFVDGKPLKTVGWEGEVDAHSFSIDYEAGNVYEGDSRGDDFL